jgi:hypothetical protein
MPPTIASNTVQDVGAAAAAAAAAGAGGFAGTIGTSAQGAMNPSTTAGKTLLGQ